MKNKKHSKYKLLSKSEKKIYDSIMSYFPKTSPDSAYDKAIEGGVNFQFILK